MEVISLTEPSNYDTLIVRKNVRNGGVIMKMAKAIEVRDNFKKYCDVAYDGEPVYISRTGNRNVVIIGADKYEELMELKRVNEIEAAVRRAEHDIKAGRVYTAEEAREYMRKGHNG